MGDSLSYLDNLLKAPITIIITFYTFRGSSRTVIINAYSGHISVSLMLPVRADKNEKIS